MSMLKCLILVLGMTVCIVNEAAYLTVIAEEVQSSCSEIFQYKSLRNGTWYGPHAILPFNTNSRELTVKFYVEEPVNDKNEVGILELYTNAILAKKDVQNLNRIQLAMTFPKWLTNSPYISSIQLNGNLICTSNVPHGSKTHTTIKLQKQHTKSWRSGNIPTLPPPEYEECGRKQSPEHLIENSYDVKIEEYPWLVAIYVKNQTSNKFYCTGTLISRKHVLTGRNSAAHCIIRPSPDKFTVVLGRTVIQDLFSPGVIRKVNRIEIHQEFNKNHFDVDLAILFLNEEVTFSETVRAACIWPAETSIYSIVGRRGAVLGWGDTDEGDVAQYPRRVFIPVVSQHDCLISNRDRDGIISNRTFCAGSRDGSGPCNEDTGSGFYLQYNNTTFIRGVLSLGFPRDGKCDLYNYVVFTDVAKHYDWIQQILHDTLIPNSKEL